MTDLFNVPQSALWHPVDFRPSSWTEHVPFAFHIVDQLRPARLVELGTWYGMSYLAFCQAVKALNLPCQAYAVDTWQGDHQTGPIAENALTRLRAAHDPKYSGFSHLLRMTFDEASASFDDHTVDLLHIDGLHTYEAVRHDFETWLPKLSKRAVVLFHDTQVRHQDFGVYRYWAEISSQYPSFEFHHEHGLGVLGVGSDLPEVVRAFFDDTQDKGLADRVRAFFARLGEGVRAESSKCDLEARVQTLSRYPEIRAALKLRRTVRIPA